MAVFCCYFLSNLTVRRFSPAELLHGESLSLHNVVAVSLYIRDMENYSVINQQYKNVFNFINPPIRVCVQAPLAQQCPIILEAVAFR